MKDDMMKAPMLREFPLPITTPRLILRNVLPGDGLHLYEAKKETMSDLLKWMDWAREENTPESNEVSIRKAYGEYILRKDFMMIGFDRAPTNGPRAIVFTGLHRMDWEKGIFEIGYWVRKSAQGEGIATENTNALLRYAFNALNAKRVVICHAEGNDASRRVIEKLGFVPCNTYKDITILPDGVVAARHWYVRKNAEDLPPLKVEWGIK